MLEWANATGETNEKLFFKKIMLHMSLQLVLKSVEMKF